MGYYVKVNPKVAEALHRTHRCKTPDGNYILWMGDLNLLGPARDRAAIVRRIGGVWLDGNQLYEEQQGRVCHELPEPEEERFRMETEAPESPEVSPEGSEPDGGVADPPLYQAEHNMEAGDVGSPALSSGTQSAGSGVADLPLYQAEHNMEGGEG